MVHLVSPQDSERYIGQTDLSQEASGFYGTDMEDRDRGEEGGDERARRGGEEEWERDTGEDRERRGGDREGEADNEDASELGHLTPDLDTLIGYSPSAHPPSSVQPDLSSPAQIHETGPQEHHASPVLEREPWETEGEEDVLSSGYGLVHSSVTTTTTATSAAPSTSPSTLSAEVAGGVEVVDTAAPETDSNAGLWTSFTSKDENSRKEDEELTGVSRQNPTEPDVGMVPSKEPLQPAVEEDEEAGEEDLDVRKFGLEDSSEGEEDEKWRKTESDGTRTQHLVPLTADSSLTASFNDSSSDWLDKSTPIQTKRSKVGGSRLKTEEMKEAQQVVCLDWKELVGRGYVILNMTQNLNCEEFRADQGVRLLKIMEHVFARRMNSPEGSWVLYLSKPTHQQHQLHMNVASESGVIATSDVLDMLGEIRKSLNKVGIQNYSATSRCHSQPSQTRSDYGKLFVVLVIIGSICMVIITSGFIYICWQRRLPATKTMFRAEELHFVENGCHDNPMLDVTNDSQPEMQEKKPSTNGLAGAGDRGKEDSSRWQVRR
uniref:Podocalyxin like 2 n=1 Tax=Cynoglossus semilaevis TaxID=244447 RepID=A0A3P8WEI0_CYNSE